MVVPKYILYFLMSFCFNDTHAMTMVTLERINTTVLNAACGIVSVSMCKIDPCSERLAAGQRELVTTENGVGPLHRKHIAHSGHLRAAPDPV